MLCAQILARKSACQHMMLASSQQLNHSKQLVSIVTQPLMPISRFSLQQLTCVQSSRSLFMGSLGKSRLISSQGQNLCLAGRVLAEHAKPLQPQLARLSVNSRSQLYQRMKPGQRWKERMRRTPHDLQQLKNRIRHTTNAELIQLAEWEAELKKLNIVQKFKKITTEYWHVICYTHFTLSCIWFGSFYVISKIFNITPQPIVNFIESRFENHEPPVIISKMLQPLKNPKIGTAAIAFFMYKMATIARYASTVFFTLFIIRRLMPKGLVKPREIPSFLGKFFRLFGIKIKEQQQKWKNK